MKSLLIPGPCVPLDIKLIFTGEGMHPITCLLGRRLGNETLAAGAPTWFDFRKRTVIGPRKKIPMYGIRTYTYLVVLKVTAEVLVSWV